MSSFFTLGYEGLKPEDFVAYLTNNDIEVLVDVREAPISRKKGFSKSQLETFLAQSNIKYVHLQKLGSPSILRKKVKDDDDYDYFFKEYKKYLKTQIPEITRLQELINNATCCLMCYEKQADTCHRKIIALKIEKSNNNGLKAIHL